MVIASMNSTGIQGMTDNLSKVIEKGILLKSEVVRYLEHFINMNGRRTGNEIALSKWKQDLEFVLQYKMAEQDEYEIRHIKKY